MTQKKTISNYLSKPRCKECGEKYNPKRKALGYTTCLDCGSPIKHFPTVVLHKQGPMVVTRLEQLTQTNQKSR